MAQTKIKRKKKPMQLAVVNQAGCTGCEVCIQFCPVDCILIVPGENNMPGFFQLVEIDLDRCIGCTLCAKNCPWDTIDMLPYEDAYRVAPERTIRSVWLASRQMQDETAVIEEESGKSAEAGKAD